MKTETTSKTDYKIIIPIIVGAVLLIGIGIFAADYFEVRADKYIIPAGYTGKVTIIYGQPDGAAEKTEGQRRIFEIPATGILSTKSVYMNKWDDYYFRSPNGLLIQLSQGGVRGGGMAMGMYDSNDTVFIKDIQTSKLDTNGKNLYLKTYYIEKKL